LRKVSVRVIAATNRDLKQTIREGRFREDLYYRLNVFPISVPPLRERGEDVVILASEFAARFAQRMGKRIEPLSHEIKRRLKAYSWPGNVRELQNVIERAVITSRNGSINLDRALPEIAQEVAHETVSAMDGAMQPPMRILPISELQQLERENILRALESSNWRVAGKDGAAIMLGINPSTLNSRIRALGIQRPR
jgi:transcriptional regulator with GAF, ATPase, and Fis domain